MLETYIIVFHLDMLVVTKCIGVVFMIAVIVIDVRCIC